MRTADQRRPKRVTAKVALTVSVSRLARHVSDFLTDKRAEIGVRLKELRPFVTEYERLQGAVAALDAIPASPAPTPARRPRAAGRKPTGARRGRPPGQGKRAEQALELVRAQPGITIPEIAERLAMKQNYLYRVMPQLLEQGRVLKRDRGWHPVPAPT